MKPTDLRLVWAAFSAYAGRRSPSYREVARILGWPSHNKVGRAVNALVKLGYLERPPRHCRAVRVRVPLLTEEVKL